jgi:hypothetical protein
MALKKIAVLFGVIFVAAGLLGCVPSLNAGGKPLGLFDVNTAHNLVHLATGILAIMAGALSNKRAGVFFQVFGLIYALVAVLGFFSGDQPLLGVVANSTPDSVLHVVIAVVALSLGFGMKPVETLPR